MEPVTITVGAGVVTLVGVASAAYGMFSKLDKSLDARIQAAVSSGVREVEAKSDLRIQALEIKLANLDENGVRKDELSGLRSDLRAVMQRLDDLIRRVENHKD